VRTQIVRVLPTLTDAPDAMLTYAVSWLDWRSYLQTCRVSRRLRRLTQLRAATPALVHLEPPICGADEGGLIGTAAAAWLKRAAPATVTFDLRRATATGALGDRWRDAAVAAWPSAVTAFARTLRLVGPVVRNSMLWVHLALSVTLTHLELRVTTASDQRAYQKLPNAVTCIASLRSLTCSGGRNALTVDSRQIALLTQLTALDITRVAHDHYARGERYHDGLIASDAKYLGVHGRLRHLRLQHATERDLLALGSTALGARLETLRVPATDQYRWLEAFPATMPALRRFETTWLSDAHAEMLAKRAPALVALEIRPFTQRVTIDAGNDDDDDDDDEDTMDRATRIVIGWLEPIAGSGMLRSLARHLPHLRELVLRRHHADLRPLSRLVALTSLDCCDRPCVSRATRWPESLPALVELRVIDITHGTVTVTVEATTAPPPTKSETCEEKTGSKRNRDRRRRLRRRFPTLAYLRFVRAEDEAQGDDCDDDDSVLNDDEYDPVRRDPENGYVAPG
jgi:hypothetical protein